MALIPGKIANELYMFIQQQNATPQSDTVRSQQEFCKKIEDMIYQSIRDATYQVLSGTAVIAGPTGPLVNPAPITVVVT